MAPITITKVQKPLPQRSVWSGKATSPRRTYEWFYDDDRQRFWARSQRPSDPRCFWDIERAPVALRAAAMIAIKQEQGQ